MTVAKIVIVFIVNFYICISIDARKPNIVLVLTDDQDLLVGGLTPVKQVQQLIANQGATFTNAFVSTPICCPSRSTILTGLYQHNHRVVNNSLSGGCSGESWQQHLEPYNFGTTLQDNGYTTFYAGKYLNTYGYKAAGGTKHVPKGWHWWLGLVGNSRYYNYTLSINGTAQHFTDQYLTNVIEKYSVDFLENMRHKENESFLMVLAPPAPHAPFTPETKYRGKYNGIKVPRTPNFNTHKLKNRHWLLNMGVAPLPKETVARVDSYYARRWETLLSVDDMVASNINKLTDIGQLDNTYIIYTSDHGYHLGQFSLPWDKRQPYETDIRVPLLLRGPGVRGKSLVEGVVVNVDIAPTILAMAGLQPPTYMDGRSFLSMATSVEPLPPRRAFLIEYVGEGDLKTVSSSCHFADAYTLSECSPSSSCKCQDALNNTYNCVRSIAHDENYIYCEFYKEVGYLKEFYDINQDPYQMENIYQELQQTVKNKLKEEILQHTTCNGRSCCK
ncbi:N-acetylglucosamine-6-sulfatase-like isoform X2 [Macrosteles quadrilineatus]|nr:N-acetylglucosamine-6-sulfatase-like isoform X2 [Macrosteles quadrilineatus]XP_054280521.1 N-acetylglucosamine-6-sulfatase-like isoform X2 [Macrosteles quadrilineatus]XP_054280522.1 N-acetylglucosamine-6-sulfatase-like isoform X2 [Macrosteles quadrilineatus]